MPPEPEPVWWESRPQPDGSLTIELTPFGRAVIDLLARGFSPDEAKRLAALKGETNDQSAP